MKKGQKLLLILVLVVAGGTWYRVNTGDTEVSENVHQVESINGFDLTIDFGEKISTYSGELLEDDTVLSVLKRASEDKHEILIKEYDFGSLIMGIDGNENTKEKSWIYFVNNIAGDMAADQKLLNPGDGVEWKYIKPIF